jgi:putative phage-type endonuclease
MNELRRKYIGGSDIAAVMGVSRWKTPLQLWAEKTGRVEAKDLSDVEYVQLGTELEDFIAKKFEKETGMKVRRAPQKYISKEFPYMACQVDRLLTGTDELLECKNASEWKAKEWEGEDIPQEYVLQVMWQLMITGRKTGWIAVLIGGNKFRYKKIEADDELFFQMLISAKSFWGMVQNEIPPMATGDDNDVLLALYPKDDEQIQAVEEMNDAIGLLQQTKQSIKDLEETKKTLEAKLKEVIRESLGIKTSEYIVTWKPQTTKRVDTEMLKEDGIYEKYLKESETRVMRVVKNKEGAK